MEQKETETSADVEAEDYADSWRPEDKAMESAEVEFRACHPHKEGQSEER